MDEEIRTFIADWMAENSSIIDDMVALEAMKPDSSYGGVLAACLASVDTDRRADA